MHNGSVCEQCYLTNIPAKCQNQVPRCYCLVRKIIRSVLFPKDFIKPHSVFYLIIVRQWEAGGNNWNLLMFFGLLALNRIDFILWISSFALHLMQCIRRQTVESTLTALLGIFLYESNGDVIHHQVLKKTFMQLKATSLYQPHPNSQSQVSHHLDIWFLLQPRLLKVIRCRLFKSDL